MGQATAERFENMPDDRIRVRVSTATRQVLYAAHRVTGKDLTAIASDWLHDRALKEIASANMVVRLTKGEDLARALDGQAGPDSEFGDAASSDSGFGQLGNRA